MQNWQKVLANRMEILTNEVKKYMYNKKALKCKPSAQMAGMFVSIQAYCSIA